MSLLSTPGGNRGTGHFYLAKNRTFLLCVDTIYDSPPLPSGTIRGRFFLAATLGYNAARRIHVQIPQAFLDSEFARSPRRSRGLKHQGARPRRRTRAGTR